MRNQHPEDETGRPGGTPIYQGPSVEQDTYQQWQRQPRSPHRPSLIEYTNTTSPPIYAGPPGGGEQAPGGADAPEAGGFPRWVLYAAAAVAVLLLVKE